MKEKITGGPVRFVMTEAFCILLNLAGRYLSSACSLPVWLDAAGTCTAACVLGPLGGAAAGVIYALLYAGLSGGNLVCIPASLAAAFVFSWCSVRGYLKHFYNILLSGFLAGLFSAIAEVPLNLYFSGGRSGNLWGDALFSMLNWNGMPGGFCALASAAIVEIPDKQICAALAFVLAGFLQRRLSSDKKKNARDGAAFLLALLLLPAALVSPLFADAAEDAETEYASFVYNIHSGMSSSEANAIEETPDGYIWIGSYAGLTRYDGQSFEYIHDVGIASVTALLTDADGRLWVGTNDGGIARYEDGTFTFFTTEDGLPVNSIRAFAQGEDGTMYVGTTDRLCAVDTEDRLRVLTEEITYVNSMLVTEDRLVGVTNAGDLFVLDTEAEDAEIQVISGGSIYYTSVAQTTLGLLAGTSGAEIRILEFQDGELCVTGTYQTGSLSYFSCIRSDNDGHTWLCANNGFGYLTEDGTVQAESYSDFDNSVECMHEDYQGNLWFASSRCGVMKLSYNRFTDLYAAAGLDSEVVNAVTEFQGCYYCGTDSGLTILTADTLEPVENSLTELLDGIRIRGLLADREGQLWLCTYGSFGLVCLKEDGSAVCYNAEEKGMLCDRFRCAIELSDGTIAAGTSEGIQFIRDSGNAGTITEADGLGNPQILCLLEDEDGTLYAGTDGAGIYVIRDGVIEENITTQDGLTSDVILRMTAWEDGFFVVTSNCLCWLENGSAGALESFPYFNNYDLLVYGGDAYVLSSCGLYVTDAAALMEDQVTQYSLYNANDGLLGGLTANAWRYVNEEGVLFFCCNNGVTAFPLVQEEEEEDYRFGVVSVVGDGEEIRAEDGVYHIPADVRRVTVKASVRNYALKDVRVRFYIEGLEEDPETVLCSELQPMQLTSLSHGSYTVHVQILSSDGESVVQEQTVTLDKEAQFWENSWYVLYLLAVGAWLVAFLTWGLLLLAQSFRRKRELEEQRLELEQKVEAQTAEIRRQTEQITEFQWTVIDGMACLIEDRDGSTGQHVLHTRYYVALIARELLRREMYPEIVNEAYVENLIRIAPLHDVGKIRISDVILNKPGCFTPEEYEQMKLHSVYGGEVIGQILGKDADPKMLRIATDVALYHHERWDGSGYPAHLAGTQIPLCARIMAVADVFDALVSERVYKAPVAPEEAFRILQEEAGSHFDAALVEVFLSQKEAALAYLRKQQK